MKHYDEMLLFSLSSSFAYAGAAGYNVAIITVLLLYTRKYNDKASSGVYFFSFLLSFENFVLTMWCVYIVTNDSKYYVTVNTKKRVYDFLMFGCTLVDRVHFFFI